MHRNPVCPGCCHSFTITDSSHVHNTKQPLLLQCGHSCCENCLLKATRTIKDKVICVVCKAVTDLSTAGKGVKSLSPDIFVNGVLHLNRKSLLEIELQRLIPAGSASQKAKPDIITGGLMKSKICCECLKNYASCRCAKCDCIVCGTCFDRIHALFKSLRHHQAIPLDDGETLPQENDVALSPIGKCEVHGKQIEFYCDDDDTLICPRCCITGEHKGHSVTSLEDRNKALMDDLEPALHTATNVLKRLKISEKKLFDHEPDYSNDCNRLIEEVKSHFRWIHGLLQIREMDIIRDVNNTFAEGATVIQKMRSQLQDSQRKLSNLVHSAKGLFHNEGETTLNGKDVLDKLTEACEMPCLLVTKDKPSQPYLHMNWSQDFVKDISSHGSIGGDVETLVSLVPLSEGGPDLIDLASESESVISSTVEDSDVIIEEETEESLSETASSTSRTYSRQSSREHSRNKPRSGRVTRKTRQLLEVQVTHIRDPSCFKVQFSSDSHQMNMMHKNLRKWCAEADSQKYRVENPSPGDLVLCRYNADEEWYRGRIKNVFYEDSQDDNSEKKVKAIEVIYFDFGNSEITTLDRVLKMQAKFMKHGEYAHECYLHDIVPREGDKGWSQEAKNTLHDMTALKDMLLSIIQEVNNVLHADLCCPPTADIQDDRPASVRDALVFLELANYFSQSHPSVTPSGYHPNRQFVYPENKRVGETFECVICHCNSPESFYTQELGVDAQYLNGMMAEMQDLYGSDKAGVWNIICPQKGMVCAAPLTCRDVWARAKVLSLPGHGQVRLQFVDYGNVETIASIRIKKLLDRFLFLPTFAIHSQLSDVIPVQETGWSQQAIQWCEDYLKDTQCSATVIKVAERLHLQILAVIDDIQYCINWKLVRDKLAVSTGKSSRLPRNTDTSALDSNKSFLTKREVVRAAADTTSDSSSTTKQTSAPKLLKRKKAPEPEDYLFSVLPHSVSSSSSVTSLSAKEVQERGSRHTIRTSDSDSTIPNDSDSQVVQESGSKDSLSTNQKVSVNVDHKSHKKKAPRKKKTGQVTKPTIPSPAGLQVFVSYFESPSKLYIQLATAEEDGLNDLQNNMEEVYSDMKPMTKSIKPGEYCAVKRHDGKWYRGRAVKDIDSSCLQVFMEDYGFLEVVDTSRLQPLTDKFIKEYGSFAQLCHLGDICPTGDITKWSKTALEFVHSELSKKKCYLVKKGEKDENGSQPIDLLMETFIQETALEPESRDYYSLCDKLKEKGLAMPVRRSEKKVDKVVENPMLTALALTKQSPPKSQSEVTSPTSPIVEPHIMLKSPCVFYKPTVIPEEKKLDVIPTYVDYGCIIYLHVIGDAADTDEYLVQLNDSMQKYFSQPSIYSPPGTWILNQACAAFYQIDNHWYRGKVIDISDNGDKLRVQYVDYGNSIWMTSDMVRADIQQFVEVPPQAVECVLHKTQPSSEQHEVWATDVLESIHEMIVNINCTVSVQDVTDEHQLSVYLQLPGGIDLTTLLCNQGLAVRVIDYNDQEKLSNDILNVLQTKIQYQSCELPEDASLFPVLITHVELPEVVYFQRSQPDEDDDSPFAKNVTKELNQLIQLVTGLHEYCPEATLLGKPKIGSPCCAQYSMDACWYRALIISLKEETQEAHVYFVDYGNSEFVSFDRLRVMPAQFMMLPTQAVRCHIDNIEPPVGGRWNLEIHQEVSVTLHSKTLLARLMTTLPIPSGVLYDPDTEHDLHPVYAYQCLADQGIISIKGQEKKSDVLIENVNPEKIVWADIVEAEQPLVTDSSSNKGTNSDTDGGETTPNPKDTSDTQSSDKDSERPQSHHSDSQKGQSSGRVSEEEPTSDQGSKNLLKPLPGGEVVEDFGDEDIDWVTTEESEDNMID